MYEYLKSLFIIVIIAAIIFLIARPAFANIFPKKDLDRYRNVWFACTLIVFLAHSYWLYIIASAVVIFWAQRIESNKVVLFFVLILAAPELPFEVPLGGVIRYLITMNHMRLLELAILLPAFIGIVRKRESLAFGRTTPDKFFAAYLLIICLLHFRGTTATDSLRFGFNTFLDIFLPYFVVSRSLRDIKQFKVAIGTLVAASLLAAGVAVFEYLNHWLLYQSLLQEYGVQAPIGSFLMRGDKLRAIASTDQPIVLGYVMMIAIGFLFFLKDSIPRGNSRFLLFAILAGGLFASLSRGPWGGTILFFIVLGVLKQRVGGLTRLIAASVVAIIFVLVLPGGEKLINLLPFIGNVDTGNVDYRIRLLDMGLTVFAENPLLGSVDYLDTPEMQSLIQGQGIIDIVNSFLGILLQYGLVGLAAFLMLFGSILWRIYKIFRRIKNYRDEHYSLGIVLFAVLISILWTIFTVSSIGVIPHLYWAIAGMGVAYTQLFKQNHFSKPSI